MKYVYIAIGILIVLIIIGIIAAIIACCVRRHRARYLVMLRTDRQKCCDLNAALYDFGFGYDFCYDDFFSLVDAWQREVGYCRFYDESASLLNMVMDCEPVYFEYNGRNYLIEFWKGQYGITTGAEIGIYVSKQKAYGHPERLFYESVRDDEFEHFYFALRKRDKVIMTRHGYHWWLTGFILGEFSHRKDLTMDICINFREVGMREAFYNSMLGLGYTDREIWFDEERICITFGNPKSKRPKRYFPPWLWIVQQINKRNCKKYMRITRFFDRTIDKVDYIAMCFPRLYRRLILNFKKNNKMSRVYKSIERARK